MAKHLSTRNKIESYCTLFHLLKIGILAWKMGGHPYNESDPLLISITEIQGRVGI